MRSSIIIATIALGMLLPGAPASAQLLKKLEQRLNGALDKLNQPTDGEPTPAAQPGYLGLTADETDGMQGVVVLATKPGSPAEAAGLKKGDLVTAINGSAVKNLDDFAAVLDRVAAGQKASFTVLRGADALTLAATLVARQAPPVERPTAPPFNPMPLSPMPLNPAAAPASEDPGPPPGGDPAPVNPPLPVPPAVSAPAAGLDAGRASLGVSVVALSEQTRLATGTSATRGAYVAAVRSGGPAERAGVPVGAVVVAVDGVRVNTADDLVQYIAAARPGQEVELSYYRGATLSRKTIRLAPAVLDARGTPAPAGISGLIPSGVADRPLVRKVEQVLDNLARPAGGVPAGQMEDVAELRSQVELLQATVRSLEERLQKLEGQLAPARPGGLEGAADGGGRLPPANAPVRGNELELAPPDRPALPTPPATP